MYSTAPYERVQHYETLGEDTGTRLRFIVTLCGSSRKSPLTILRGRISMPRQESAPRKVRVSHIMGHDQSAWLLESQGLWTSRSLTLSYG
jgi:hypothetical protein